MVLLHGHTSCVTRYVHVTHVHVTQHCGYTERLESGAGLTRCFVKFHFLVDRLFSYSSVGAMASCNYIQEIMLNNVF